MNAMLLDRLVAKILAAPVYLRKRTLATHVRLIRQQVHLPPATVRPKWTPPLCAYPRPQTRCVTLGLRLAVPDDVPNRAHP